ncbi:MAP9 protein, partial [Ibidorhyncha struthersii]|nr:MAP9 protein [Ibidorhyncha struthersii]
TSRNGLCSFLVTSSLTTLNAQAMPKKKLLAESPGPEGPWLESTSPPFSINFASHNERSGDSNLLMSGEAPPAKDQDQNIRTSDLKLEDNSRKSPSVTESMMTTVKKLEKSTDDSSDEVVKIVEEQIVTDTIQKVSVSHQSEHGEVNNTSEDSVKEHYLISATINGKMINMFVSWYFHRSLSPAQLKKKLKAVPSATPVSSQYLGTLKVLEDKHVQNNSTEFDKADRLRAAVFQNWLEKKRVFLLELRRIEKKKAENLRNNTEKEEAVKRAEAIASFEAWKKKKGREAKKLSEKKKDEELKKKKAAEQNEERMEAAQKSQMQHLVCYMIISCSSLSLYRNEKKEEYMKQKKVEKILERRKQEIQQAKKEEKNKKALEEYERWLEKKEKREQHEKKQKKLQAVHGDQAPSPWSPPGKVTYSRNF